MMQTYKIGDTKYQILTQIQVTLLPSNTQRFLVITPNMYRGRNKYQFD